MWRRSSVAIGVFASLVLHGASLLGLRSERPDSPARKHASSEPYEAAFEALAPTTPATAPVAWLQRRLLLGAPARSSALDQDAADGRGGEAASTERALLLFSFVSPVTLQDTELNNFDENQTQRISTSAQRATQEERRATPNPEDAVFLASGSSGHAQRRKPSREDAWLGAASPRSEPTGELDRREQSAGEAAVEARAPARQQRETSAAESDRAERRNDNTTRGIAHGTGSRQRLAARVQHARPNVDRGPAATPAELLDEQVRDNHDAELLAALLQRSIVDASTQRAARRAEGVGGVSTGLGASLEGDARGARAQAYLPGSGTDRALDTRDARYVRWFVEQKQRVQDELVFPKPRALAMDQGVSVYRVVLRRDGRLADAPRLVRSSGFADFDQAAVLAIRRALPFSPLPERLSPDAEDFPLLIPVAFANPMVR